MIYFIFFLLTIPFVSWADAPPVSTQVLIDVKKIFLTSPFIYGALCLMSIGSMVIWLYTLFTFRSKEIMPASYLSQIRPLLEAKDWERAKEACKKQPNLLASIIDAGLITRELGPSVMMDAMKAEGKRVSTPFWQRLSILNDIAIVAPMLGLLGTVIGMFYAFYDINRSVESINALFDGLGISVGTTVAGLVVAILSMIFSTTLKYRIVKTLSFVENQAVTLSTLIPRS